MRIVLKVIIGTATLCFISSTSAQGKGERMDFGKREFDANCASCHGTNGKGNGPITDLLKQGMMI